MTILVSKIQTRKHDVNIEPGLRKTFHINVN